MLSVSRTQWRKTERVQSAVKILILHKSESWIYKCLLRQVAVAVTCNSPLPQARHILVNRTRHQQTVNSFILIRPSGQHKPTTIQPEQSSTFNIVRVLWSNRRLVAPSWVKYSTWPSCGTMTWASYSPHTYHKPHISLVFEIAQCWPGSNRIAQLQHKETIIYSIRRQTYEKPWRRS